MNQESSASQMSVAPQENLRPIIATNITNLRKSFGMTQQDLALRLNYTDKAVSKWERGESVPDIVILKQIADMFGVTVDYLLQEEHEIMQGSVDPSDETEDAQNRHTVRTRGFITGMSILLVWLAAVMMFIVFDTMSANPLFHWFVFACAVCASLILWLVMNSIWFNRRRNYLIISLLMWSILILLYMSIWLLTDRMLWLIFILGIPGQAIIVMWSNLKQHGIR